MIILGSDHAGFELKEKLKAYLQEKGEQIEDVGTHSPEPSDYPEFAAAIGRRVALSNGADKGVALCGSGVGMAIAANKIDGVRAVDAESKEMAIKSREDDDTNVLTLPARMISFEDARDIMDIWLSTPFSGKERHSRRIDEITDLEHS